MTPDSPEIANLRRALTWPNPVTAVVLKTDLYHALRLIDEARDSCRSCAFVDEIRKQGERLTRMYDLFNEVMVQRRSELAERVKPELDPTVHTCSKPCPACASITYQLTHGGRV